MRSGEVLIGGMSVSEIAEEFGTPLFLYDRSILESQWSKLRNALPSEVSICYSVKANPTRALLQFFLSKGAGLEIASLGEFQQALHAGCTPENIIFAGPGKTERELDHIIRADIGEIHVESITEAHRIAGISQRLGRRTAIALRINPSSEAQGGAMRMGGKPAPFGIDEEQLDEALDFVFAEPALELYGIHLFSGTQILDYGILLTQYRKGMELARRVASRMGTALRTLDFGGGFGIPYFEGDKELDATALRLGLDALMNEYRQDDLFAGTRFVVEPGRYLVGECGIYVMRINDIKVSRGKTFYICDGGMHHHLSASGNLGQTIKRNFPISVLTRTSEVTSSTAEVVGPLCTPLDVLGRGASLPKAEIGDLIGVFQSGAYGRSASPLGFLSHRSPAEVLVEDGKAYLIRAAGDYADYERDLCAPATVKVAHGS